jgi:hypothetical protein
MPKGRPTSTPEFWRQMIELVVRAGRDPEDLALVAGGRPQAAAAASTSAVGPESVSLIVITPSSGRFHIRGTPRRLKAGSRRKHSFS